MIKRCLFFLSLSSVCLARTTYPPGGFQDNFWQQVQIQHLQTQLQLQAQDQYRRQLLIQDQQRQIDQLGERQDQFEFMNRNSQMHDYSDRLRMYSRSIKAIPKSVKKK